MPTKLLTGPTALRWECHNLEYASFQNVLTLSRQPQDREITPMNYRELKNWGPDNRTLILPQDSFDTEKESPPDSGDVLLIRARECPDGKSCIQIEYNGNTSLCAYMRGYPDLSIQGEPGLTSLACDHPKASAHPEVDLLMAFCPADTNACIDGGTTCEYLENVLTPEQVSGAHYHVFCDQV